MGQCCSKKLINQTEAKPNSNPFISAYSKTFPPFVINHQHRIRKYTGDIPTLQPISNSSILRRRTYSATLVLYQSK